MLGTHFLCCIFLTRKEKEGMKKKQERKFNMENLCLSRRESNNAILCVCATACLPAYVADNYSNVVELAHVGSLYYASLKMTMKDDDLLSRCNYYK